MIKNYLTNTVSRYASKWLVLSIDIGTISFAFVLSYIIRFNVSFGFDFKQLYLQLPIVVGVSVLAFFITGSFKGVVRHTGIRDVYNIFNAICLSSILLIFAVILNRNMQLVNEFTIPLSIIIIFSLVSFLGLTASRYLFKSIYNGFIRDYRRVKNILIYGAGESGIITYDTITSHSRGGIKVLGYIDNDAKKSGKSINGVKVYGPDEISDKFLSQHNISEIIVSIQKIEANKLRDIVQELMQLPVKVKIVPPVEKWINGELKVSQIRQVQIEDLLQRPPISLKNRKIQDELKGKVIMVTGGAGSIGSELVRQICHYNYRHLIIIDQAESALYDLQQELKRSGYTNFVAIVGDVRDKNRMNNLFQEYRPQIIFHAAAYKHVPLMEYNSYEAVKININGTKVISDLADRHNAERFVFVSTDKAVNPTNIMGATKRIAEMYISCMQQSSKTKFIITRFGNVLGSNGSVIPLFRKQIEMGGPLTVTHKDITRYFMTIPEASHLVLEAAVMGAGGEIFVFDMGESVKIFDLARNMIHLSGLRYPEDVDIKITGLRPGEKLYEELLASGENTLPTHHKKIMISKSRDLDYVTIRTKIDELCINNMFFSDATVSLMKEIVPEFISNNSQFCKLDRQNISYKSLKPELKSVQDL
ncbi:polysaccharide biosynthesis protein [Lentiprolixibacter aurantiacus]|uniref:Nucleoside-diphosphate sugar epimerase/dehydratase n=1 Tax=Lentiprolixibacter aurantiacus TaxID=2993939 RepID=A0AAE3MMZ6_9FLAO|nr:nucleoside-diphosphate sugar epimerase/dehydratase [Lentiprolixibacter aurantiacus]MCX2719842.1 nucleoside-diphosphate sugar epimerase/dehydratase [Lentiprolixibacter aurantiacus]